LPSPDNGRPAGRPYNRNYCADDFLRDHQIFLIIDEKKGDVKKEGRPITPPAEEIPQPRAGGIRFVPLYRGNSLLPVCFS
jgi:hypothetical protein